jgi:hypothetical protein
MSTLCREMDWSPRRLFHEVEHGRVPYRTIPEGYRIEWDDDFLWPYINIEASEIRIPYGIGGLGIWTPPPNSRRVPHHGLTLGIEVLPPDAESPTPTAKWVFNTAGRLQTEGKICEGMTKAAVARLVAAEAPAAVKADKLDRALKAAYLENQLSAWGIWPLNSRK